MKINIKDKIPKETVDNFCDKYGKIILIFFILLFAISRLYKFGELPRAISVDEAGMAYDAYCIANFGVDRYLNSFPLYFINFGGGQSALYTYMIAGLIKIFGLNSIVYRLPELIIFTMRNNLFILIN